MVKVHNKGGLVSVAGVDFQPGLNLVEQAAFDKAMDFKVGGKDYLAAYFQMGRLKLIEDKAPEPKAEESEAPKEQPEKEVQEPEAKKPSPKSKAKSKK